MADTMAMPRHPFNMGTVSQTHKDITEDRYRELRRPRKVRFYCNGDRYFKGKKMYITPHRYVSFNDLLNDLTSKLPSGIYLPYGVRQIFTPVDGKKVRDIEDLQDGLAYVCGGFEPFKSIKYGQEQLSPWTTGKPQSHDFFDGLGDLRGSYRQGEGHVGFQPSKTLRQSYPGSRRYGTFGNRAGHGSYWGAQSQDSPTLHKPKVITIVHHGPSPRTSVKILLNRRVVQSYEQMMKDISEAFGPKWKNNKVRKLFTIKGREVMGISDFFREDEVFIGVGNEALTTGDVQDILEEMYPESPYSQNLMKEWEKQRKKFRQHHSQKPRDRNFDNEKRDSGLGSDASNRDDLDEIIYKGRTKRTKDKGREKDNIFPPQDQEGVTRMEKERQRAADEERERARKRMQKKMEAEKRALEEERRKRGLAPLKPIKDPFKKMQDDREREVDRQRREALEKAQQEEEERLAQEQQKEKARKKEEERKRKEEERKKKEEEEASKVIVVVKGDVSPSPRHKKEIDEDESNKVKEEQNNDQENIEYDLEKNKQDLKSKKSAEKEDTDKYTEKEKITDENDNNKDHIKDDQKKENYQKIESMEKQDETKDNQKKESLEKQDDTKEEQQKEAKDPPKKKQSKNIIHKTKVERQISNLSHVLNKYEPGKVLGDGNFAVVKQCKLKNTLHEYAMKVIDKSKLKGKEHMVENEIEIMKLCHHPNIVKLMEEFETKDEIYLIMELVKGGDLFDAITQSVKFGEPESAGMVADLANALFYLHSRGIVHRDLKPENLMVCRNKDGSVTLKLADFGLAMEVKEPIFTVCGTPTYVAPEILSEIGYGLEVDMWAVGVITYILLCGFPPFRSPDRNQTELFEFIKAGEFEFLAPYWDNISKSAKDLIDHLLVVNKKKRYNPIDVLCHPWIITQAGTVTPPTSIDKYRKQLREDLEAQARSNWDSFHSDRES